MSWNFGMHCYRRQYILANNRKEGLCKVCMCAFCICMFAMLLYYHKVICCGLHSPNNLSRECCGRRECILVIQDKELIRSNTKKSRGFRLCSSLWCLELNKNMSCRKKQTGCQVWYHVLNGKCEGQGIPGLQKPCCRSTTCFSIQLSDFCWVQEQQKSSVND